MQKRIFFGLLVVVITCAASIGCGSGKLKTYPVSGTITMNGEPVTGATVIFNPDSETDGDAATGITNEKGEYKLQTANGKVDGGTTPGNYTVMVKKTEFVKTGAVTYDSSGNTSEETLPQSLLPQQFGSPRSPLKAVVEKKKNTFDFKLDD
ncbi:MAG: hypothetical protein ACRC2T_18905 [Thermoguttaceae bacterium]